MPVTIFLRHFGSINLLKLPLLERKPTSIKTDGISGALSTENPADWIGRL